MKDITLHLGNKTQVSTLKYNVYKEDLDRINNDIHVDDNQVKIDKSYIVKNEDKLEAGFFIRNTSNEKIEFENLTLALQNKKGETVATQEFSFDGYEPIPPMSAVPYAIDFDICDITSYDEIEEYDIMFIGVDKVSVIRKADIEIDGAADLGYEAESVIKEFIKELPTLEDGTIDVNPFKISKTSDGDIKVIIIFRNGNENNIELEQLPVTLLCKDEVVCRKVVNTKGNVIPGKRAKLLTVLFVKEEINTPVENLTGFQVLIK